MYKTPNKIKYVNVMRHAAETKISLNFVPRVFLILPPHRARSWGR